jgi:hypothetical protein
VKRRAKKIIILLLIIIFFVVIFASNFIVIFASNFIVIFASNFVVIFASNFVVIFASNFIVIFASNFVVIFAPLFLKVDIYMNEIIKDKLYLGDMFDANDKDEIKKKNISCIVCVADNLQINNTNLNVKVYKYDISDDYNCIISLYFDDIGEIINNEDIVLVNCAAGISRSSTIVIAYIMKYYNVNLKNTFIGVREKRNRICPNKNFMKNLLEYELSLFGKNSLTYDECVQLFYYT